MNIKRARQILGSDADGLTDEQLMSEISTAEVFANIAIDKFLKMSPKERAKFAKKK